jgi:carboxyl-terminal processing protease
VSTIDGKEPRKYVSEGKNDVDIPVYILVNWQTASAAEILASALHVHLKAPIFGTQTYGKWSVQELFSLSNGAQIKVTTAHWLTAAGDKLDGKWIIPDSILLPKIQDLVAGKDGQKEEAIERIKKGNTEEISKKE